MLKVELLGQSESESDGGPVFDWGEGFVIVNALNGFYAMGTETSLVVIGDDAERSSLALGTPYGHDNVGSKAELPHFMARGDFQMIVVYVGIDFDHCELFPICLLDCFGEGITVVV